MKETVHLAGLEEMAAASAADFKAWDEAVGADEADHRPKVRQCRFTLSDPC
jgi:ferredoxin-nitrite reductase